MIGRRSTYARRVLKEVVLESCTNHQVPWLKKSAFHSIDFFVRLQNCAKGKDKIYCQRQEVEKERKNLKLIHNSEEKYVTEHLLLGTAKIAGFYWKIMEVFQDQFVIPFDGYNYTIDPSQSWTKPRGALFPYSNDWSKQKNWKKALLWNWFYQCDTILSDFLV